MMPRYRLLLAGYCWLLAPLAYATDFSGFWEHTDQDKILGETQTRIVLVQRGNRVCGEWGQINHQGKLFSGGTVGVVKGQLLQLKTDELTWNDDAPTSTNATYDQFKMHRGLLFQLDRDGQLPDQTTQAAGLAMALTKNPETDPAVNIGEEALAKCFSGSPFGGWNVGDTPIKKAKKAKRAPASAKDYGR